jgi:pimeloyl-ACP methyl ester carboxylesterase
MLPANWSASSTPTMYERFSTDFLSGNFHALYGASAETEMERATSKVERRSGPAPILPSVRLLSSVFAGCKPPTPAWKLYVRLKTKHIGVHGVDRVFATHLFFSLTSRIVALPGMRDDEAMDQELLTLDLRQSVRNINVPVLMFLGRYDQHLESQRAARCFAELHAPTNKLVWFEQSAHNVPFEEPVSFNAAVVRELQSLETTL